MDCREIEESVQELEEWELEEFKEFCKNMKASQTNSSVGRPVVDENFCMERGYDQSHLRILFALALTLAYGALVRRLLRASKLSIPYTVVIFLSGNIVGILSRILGPAVRSYTEIARIPPKIYLFIFLPVLVFESAFSLNQHTFYQASAQIILLAFPGMVLATFIAAYVCLIILPSYEWTVAEAIWFGSIASATDPVAVVAILRELGASEVLGILIEGESLLNDGVAVLMFDVLEELLTCQIEINLSLYVLQKFCQVTLGGPAFGYLMGKIAVASLSNTFNDATIEITITLGAAYLTYYISEDILGVSGILAVVALGVIIGSEKTCISPEVESLLHHFWEMVGYLANTVIFMIIGIIITETALNDVTVQDWIYLIYLYLVLNFIRLVMLIILYPFLNRFGYGITWRNLIVMFWGGLRGAVGTCLALEVYENEHLCQKRNLGPKFLFQTAGNVFLTLLINATTTKPLLSSLRLLEVSPGALEDMKLGVSKIKATQSKATAGLKLASPAIGANWAEVHKYASILNPYDKGKEKPNNAWEKMSWTKEHGYSGDGGATYKNISSKELEKLMDDTRIRVLRAMKCSFWRQFEQGLLTPTAVLKLVKIASQAQEKPLALMHSHELTKYLRFQSYSQVYPFIRVLQKLKMLRPTILRRLDSEFYSKLFFGYEIGKGFIFGLSDAINLLPQIVGHRKVLAKIMKALVDQRTKARLDLGILQSHHPGIGTGVKTRHASRLVLNQMRQTLLELQEDGLLDEEEWARLLVEIEGKMKGLSKIWKSIPSDTPDSILKNVSWIRGDEEIYKFFVDQAQLLTFTFGDKIYAWDDASHGVYIIIFGTVKIEYTPSEEILLSYKAGNLPNTELIIDTTFGSRGEDFFFTGTVVGEKGVLTGQRRSASVTCETTVQAYYISESSMQTALTRFTKPYASLEERLWQAVGRRLAYAVIPSHPKFASWDNQKIQTYIESSYLPIPSSQNTIWIEASIADLLVIQGKVTDTLSRETFTAPQLLPRRVSKIKLAQLSNVKTRVLAFPHPTTTNNITSTTSLPASSLQGNNNISTLGFQELESNYF